MKKVERELLLQSLRDSVSAKAGVVMIPEYRFHDTRKWRFDLAILPGPRRRGIAMEIEGGAWVQGRHVRGTGYEKDMEKYNEAQLFEWMVLRVTWKQVKNGEALKLILRALMVDA